MARRQTYGTRLSFTTGDQEGGWGVVFETPSLVVSGGAESRGLRLPDLLDQPGPPREMRWPGTTLMRLPERQKAGQASTGHNAPTNGLPAFQSWLPVASS